MGGRLISPMPVLGPLERKPQVIAELRQVDSACFQHGRSKYKAIQISGLHRTDPSAWLQSMPHTGDVFDNVEQVNGIDVDSSSYSCCSDIENADLFYLLKAADVPGNNRSIGFKGLAQTNGNSVLKLGAPHFNHIIKLYGLGHKSLVKAL